MTSQPVSVIIYSVVIMGEESRMGRREEFLDIAMQLVAEKGFGVIMNEKSSRGVRGENCPMGGGFPRFERDI